MDSGPACRCSIAPQSPRCWRAARGSIRHSAEAEALSADLESDAMRIALGRIACGYDGGQI